ncbi:carboxy terminal-processing peptidase [Polluticaenibacter yanchengensis]|uniref:Carboxy terminal-processing peptidase n=1 Tax=Polluticaenibacter yanchengensis TaxID=3014562 RepID=A0ABT4UHF8_9BACT|nr:carboxy terminal-processing peptidase [Chitinophagaceae bacterium LY-5]
MRLQYLIALAGLFSSPVNAQTNNVVNKSQYIINKLAKEHYSPVDWLKVNDTVFIEHLLDELDEEKLLFYKAETDELRRLSADIKTHTATNLQLLYNKTFQHLKSAYGRKLKFITDLQNINIDLNKNDSLPLFLKDFAATPKELERRWQVLLQNKVYARLVQQLKLEKDNKINTTVKPTVAQINTAKADIVKKYTRYLSYYDSDAWMHEFLEDVFLNAVCYMYDPHSSYFNFDSHKTYDAMSSATIYTSGIVVNKNKQNHYEIVHVIPGSPAWNSGSIFKGDIIRSVKHKDQPVVLMEDLDEDTDDIQDLFTTSSQQVIEIDLADQNGVSKKVSIYTEKEADEQERVRSYVIKNSDKNIGYIQLPGFYSVSEDDENNSNGCSNDIAKELVKLKQDNVEGLILDLRNNGGGSMQEAIELLSIFIQEGVLFTLKDPTGKIIYFKDPNRGTLFDKPLVIMINNYSASASELISSALQDYNRALIVGTNSYGKGTAQREDILYKSSVAASKNDYVKFTIGKFYRVTGNTVQKTGVEPDVILPVLNVESKVGEKYQPTALSNDFSKLAIYKPLTPIPKTIIAGKSNKRVNEDAYFQTLLPAKQAIEKLLDYTYYTNWQKFLQQESRNLDIENTLSKRKFDTNLTITNNSTDEKNFKMYSEGTVKNNEEFIKKIKTDNYIKETNNIILDWINQK